MKRDYATLGARGEEEAVQYLTSRGYRVLERNWKTKRGELDIVASKNGVIIFIEVKTRLVRVDNPDYFAEDSIDQSKRRKLRRLGEEYLLRNFPEDTEWQIDVIAVDVTPLGVLHEIRHLEQAITG